MSKQSFELNVPEGKIVQQVFDSNKNVIGFNLVDLHDGDIIMSSIGLPFIYNKEKSTIDAYGCYVGQYNESSIYYQSQSYWIGNQGCKSCRLATEEEKQDFINKMHKDGKDFDFINKRVIPYLEEGKIYTVFDNYNGIIRKKIFIYKKGQKPMMSYGCLYRNIGDNSARFRDGWYVNTLINGDIKLATTEEIDLFMSEMHKEGKDFDFKNKKYIPYLKNGKVYSAIYKDDNSKVLFIASGAIEDERIPVHCCYFSNTKDYCGYSPDTPYLGFLDNYTDFKEASDAEKEFFLNVMHKSSEDFDFNSNKVTHYLENGEIYVVTSGDKTKNVYFIANKLHNNRIYRYCSYWTNTIGLITWEGSLGKLDAFTNIHKANDKEREFFNNKLKENGYKWNSETKKLERCFVPKKGDFVEDAQGDIFIYNGNTSYEGYGKIASYNSFVDDEKALSIEEEDRWVNINGCKKPSKEKIKEFLDLLHQKGYDYDDVNHKIMPYMKEGMLYFLILNNGKKYIFIFKDLSLCSLEVYGYSELLDRDKINYTQSAKASIYRGNIADMREATPKEADLFIHNLHKHNLDWDYNSKEYKPYFVPKDGDVCICKNIYGKFDDIIIYKETCKLGDQSFIRAYCTYDKNSKDSIMVATNTGYISIPDDLYIPIRIATTEEKNTLIEKLHELKKDFDFEEKKIIPYRWRVKKGEFYYTVMLNSERVRIYKSREQHLELDDDLYKSHNYFKTREEAQEVADKINKIFKEL